MVLPETEKEEVYVKFDKVLSGKLKLHIMRNTDFKPEPTKRLRPMIRNFDEYVDYIFKVACECPLKQNKD
jgi:hypothetical protein